MASPRLKSPLAQAVGPVLAGIAFLVVLALALWGVAVWVTNTTGEGSTLEVRLGDDEFNLGDATRRSEAIARDGPVLYPGLIGADRGYIVVNHLGNDPYEGWYAFSATAPGQPVTCVVQWQSGRQQFVDPCTEDAYPSTGEGLEQFAVRVTPDNEVVVDLTPGGLPGRGTLPTG
jgi:hypothetical protein